MRQETWMDISALEKTQPINRQNANNNISTGYYNLQDQATPNPRVKQFGVTDTPNIIQSTARQIMTSDRISITPPGYQNQAHMYEETPPQADNVFGLSQISDYQPVQFYPNSEAKKEEEKEQSNPLPLELTSPELKSNSEDRYNYDNDDNTSQTSIYSYDSNFNSYKKMPSNMNFSPNTVKNSDNEFQINLQNMKMDTMLSKEVTFNDTVTTEYQQDTVTTEHRQDTTSQRKFNRYEVPMFTVICAPNPTPIMEEAFFLNFIELPNPITTGNKVEHQFESLHSASSGSQKLAGSSGDGLGHKSANQISLSPSYRTPATEGIYSTNKNL